MVERLKRDLSKMEGIKDLTQGRGVEDVRKETGSSRMEE
jgi:hypothetical protein